MMIWKAESNDAGKIHDLAMRLRAGSHETGFLSYVLPEHGYDFRIRAFPKFFYVAGEPEKDLEGFLMCYDSADMRSLTHMGQLQHESGIVDFLAMQEVPFVYGDQIGTRYAADVIGRGNSSAQKGVGEAMLKALFGEMSAMGIPHFYVAVEIKPKTNRASIAFRQRLGFEDLKIVENPGNSLWQVKRYSVKSS